MNLQQERAIATIQEIKSSIINDNSELLDKLLRTLPIQKLNKKISDMLLYDFLVVCAKYNKISAGLRIFNLWKIPFEANEGKISVYVSLYLEPRYNPQLLSFCSKIYPSYTFSECIDELMILDDDHNIYVAGYKLLKVYGTQTINTYKNISNISKNKNNIIYNFIIKQIRKINDYAKIPEYIIGPDILPRESEIIVPDPPIEVIKIPSIDDMVNILLDGMYTQGITFDEIESTKELLRIRLSMATLQEKINILKPVQELKMSQNILQRDKRLFMIYGPSNPHYGSTVEEMKYGGSRMLLSGAYDYEDENQEIPSDWFSGYCWKCNLRIRRRWHAIRRPVPHGGWKGCYCSIKCLRESIDESDKIEIVNQLLTDIYEEQIHDIGILDRIPDIKYDEYLNGNLEMKYISESERIFLDKTYPSIKLDHTKRPNNINIHELQSINDIKFEGLSIEQKVNRSYKIEYIEDLEQLNDLMNRSSIKLVIIYYHRINCKYCADMNQFYKILSSDYNNYIFADINMNNAKLRPMLKILNVENVPAFIIYKNKIKINEVIGAHKSELTNMLNHTK
uniref:Thioredoxin-related protein n=1 Tax=Pithovirus LCPAC102 TaxID=2506587 RepID=A0A481Z367_9VIRU|nr:MAG: thioredoxin-related protein [Pithovirus LCPAC102]